MFSERVLSGKKILITGGGSGIGRSLGTRFLELGAEIVICGRRAEVLKGAVAEWTTSGGKASYVVCDVRLPEQVDAMFNEIWLDRPLDGLVNNAAGNFIARTETLSPRAFDSVIDIVLHGSAYCTLAAGKRWIEGTRRGTILSILTTSVWQGRAFMVPSATAKAGVLSMMRSLATEWGPKGIRTVMVAPGIFPTPGASARLYPDPAEYEAQIARIPVGRVGQHAELANLCSYLMFPSMPVSSTATASRWTEAPHSPREVAAPFDTCMVGALNNGRSSGSEQQERTLPHLTSKGIRGLRKRRQRSRQRSGTSIAIDVAGLHATWWWRASSPTGGA